MRIEDIPADGIFIAPANLYVTGVGQVLRGVHEETDSCAGRGCVVHAPSEHPLRTAKTYWRAMGPFDIRSGAFMERICEHGTGHPDPDQIAFWQQLVEAGEWTQENLDAELIHGCCGCCSGQPYDAQYEESDNPSV